MRRSPEKRMKQPDDGSYEHVEHESSSVESIAHRAEEKEKQQEMKG
jgi:hypothetical protein